MRVFVSGASGAIGAQLVPQLIEHGHQVTGTYTSSPAKAKQLRALGADPVQLDLLDAAAVTRAVRDAEPDAIIHEATALDGGFYGAANDQLPGAVRKGMFPIIGNGEGYMSFIHLQDAAAATVLALERGEPGIYNIVDEDPAPIREWLPELANALGARPPRHMVSWLARLVAGKSGVRTSTESRGASNAKAKREFGWTLRYPSWRQGFIAVYAPTTPPAQNQDSR